MHDDDKKFAKRVNTLEHLMGKQEQVQDFREPTMLKEIPSFNSTDTICKFEGLEDAKLEGSPK